MKRDPLVLKGWVVAGVTAILNIIVWFGLDIAQDLQAEITAVSGSAAAIIVAFLARKDVTPVDDPRDNEGNPLTPESEFEKDPDRFIEVGSIDLDYDPLDDEATEWLDEDELSEEDFADEEA